MTVINLGIVIAVHEYTSPLSSLPGCMRDGDAVAKVLETSGRFDDVLIVCDDTRSASTKERIVEFVNKHKGKEVGDVVFYYTGHGDFFEDEFYYLMSDHDPKRKKQTSLQNSELDGLMRTIGPNLFVKIVDACHSGVSYIKSAESFDKYLKGSTNIFNKLYFMFSSKSEQSSYQDNTLSFFTRRIIEGIVSHDAHWIRYKDLIDYVSDAFSSESGQTPFFVTQADFTEAFCESSAKLKASIGAFLLPTASMLPVASGIRSIADLIKEDAKQYCNREEALEAFRYFFDEMKDVTPRGELGDLYGVRCFEEPDDPPGAEAIGEWLHQNNGDKRYFASVKRLSKEVPSVLGGFRERQIIVGYNSTVPLPCTYFLIRATPSYPNLSTCACFVVPVISKTHLRLFWSFAFFEDVGWDERQLFAELMWTTDEIALRNRIQLRDVAHSILSQFWAFLEEPIKARWSPQDAGQKGEVDATDDSTEGDDPAPADIQLLPGSPGREVS